MKLRYIKLFTRILVKRYSAEMGEKLTPIIFLFYHIVEQALDDLYPRQSRHKSAMELTATQKDAHQYFKGAEFEAHAYHCGLEPEWVRMKLQRLNLVDFSHNLKRGQ